MNLSQSPSDNSKSRWLPLGSASLDSRAFSVLLSVMLVLCAAMLGSVAWLNFGAGPSQVSRPELADSRQAVVTNCSTDRSSQQCATDDGDLID